MASAADFWVIFVLMRDSLAVKLETRIKGNFAQSGDQFATSTREFPVPLNRTENSRDTLRNEKLKIRRNNHDLIEFNNDKTQSVVTNMTDCAGLQYDWRLRLSRLNVTDFDLAKYDWRRLR
jgi:hypothetical protein